MVIKGKIISLADNAHGSWASGLVSNSAKIEFYDDITSDQLIAWINNISKNPTQNYKKDVVVNGMKFEGCFPTTLDLGCVVGGGGSTVYTAEICYDSYIIYNDAPIKKNIIITAKKVADFRSLEETGEIAFKSGKKIHRLVKAFGGIYSGKSIKHDDVWAYIEGEYDEDAARGIWNGLIKKGWRKA